MKNVLKIVLLCIGFACASYADQEGEEYYRKAQECIEKKDADNAIIYLHKAIDSGYHDGYTYAILASLYEIKGLDDTAKKYYTLALKLLEEQLQEHTKSKSDTLIRSTNESIARTKRSLEKLKVN